jgi:hypothetical protein
LLGTNAAKGHAMSGEAITGLFGLIIMLTIYFIPALVARYRQHQQTLAIFMLSLLLGWTGIGWMLALIWACTAVQRPQVPA